MRRKGMGKGLGKGYRNMISVYDSHIHSLSAKGVKSCVPSLKQITLNARSSMTSFKMKGTYSIVCYSEGTRSGFRHMASLLKSGSEVASAKATYLNRTWESYEYQSVIYKLLNKYFPEKEAKERMEDLEKNRRGLYAKGNSLSARGLAKSQKYRRQYSYVRNKGLLTQIEKLKTFFPDLKTEIEKSKNVSATNRIVKAGGKMYRLFLVDGGNLSNGVSVMYSAIYNITDKKMIMSSKDISSWMPPIAYIYADLKGIDVYKGAKELGY